MIQPHHRGRPRPRRKWPWGLSSSSPFVIVANIGTATVFFPILKRQNEAGALSYVTARVMESVFIAIGVISMLTFLFMRQEGTGTNDLGNVFISLYDRAFLSGLASWSASGTESSWVG